MSSNPTTTPQRTQAPLRPDAVLRQIQAQSRYVFASEEFGALTGREAGGAALKLVLQRLAKQGRIALASRRPARWLILPPEHTHFGAPPVDWWINDFLKGEEPNYYVGLLSAARHWGSAHYALQVTQVMVSKPRRPVTVGRLTIDFFSKRVLAGTPTVTVRNGVAPWRVSTREATLLDLIRHQSSMGGMEIATRVARDFARSIEASALLAALGALDQVPVAQRFGFLLERLGAKERSSNVAKWLASKRVTTQPFDTAARTDIALGEIDPRWKIRYHPRDAALIEELR